MRKKLLYLSLLLCAFGNVRAQEENKMDSLEIQRLLQLEAKRSSVGISYNLGLANDDIGFGSLFKLGFTNKLDKGDKEEILGSLINGTRLGYTQNFSLYYRQPSYASLDNEFVNGFSLAYYNKVHAGLRFPKNSADLLLRGNKPFAGESLKLDDTEYEDWWYSTLEYKYEWLPSLNINASFHLGHSYKAVNIEKASIFTEENGEYIQASLKYDLMETENNNALNVNGMGVSTGLDYTYVINDDYSLAFQIEDLGFMFWNQISRTSVDSSFTFRGIEFNSIFDINDSIISSERDRFQRGFFNANNDRELMLMPFEMRAYLLYSVNHLNLKRVYGSFTYRYITGYVPRVAVGMELLLNGSEDHQIGAELAYGGFNTLSLGASYEVNFSENWSFNIGSSNLLAILLPQVATGSSVFTGLQYYF